MKNFLFIFFALIIMASVAYASMTMEGQLTFEGVSIPDEDAQILAIGDSITWGNSATDCAGFKTDLFSLLSNTYAFVGSVSVPACDTNGDAAPDSNSGYSCGFSANRSDQINDKTDACLTYLTPSYIPNIVTIHAGTNDINYTQGSQITATDTVNNIKSMVDKVVANDPTTKIFVAKIIPRESTYITFDTCVSEPQHGDTVTQDGSGVSVTVLAVEITGGACTGAGVGKMYYKNADGTLDGTNTIDITAGSCGGSCPTNNVITATAVEAIGSNPDIDDINTEIDSELTSYTGVTAIVDMTGIDTDTMYNDSPKIHPNDAGYEWMAEQWATAINSN